MNLDLKHASMFEVRLIEKIHEKYLSSPKARNNIIFFIGIKGFTTVDKYIQWCLDEDRVKDLEQLSKIEII